MNPLRFLLTSLLATVTSAWAIPTISISFSPSTIGPGSVSTLTYTLENANDAQSYTGLAFSNTLPAGVTIATPAGLSTTCTGAVVEALDGGSTLDFSGGSLVSDVSCTVTLSVTSATAGTHTNSTSDLSYDGMPQSTPGAAANLTVDTNRPGFHKSFSPATIAPGQTSRLTFTIDNTLNDSAIYNLVFSDTLPAGLVVAPIPNATTDCNSSLGGSLVATAGGNTISLNAPGFGTPLDFFNVLPGQSCTASVDLIAVSAGKFNNLSGDLTSYTSNQVNSGKSTAQLVVERHELLKTFLDDPVVPGGTVTLQFTLTNFDRSDTATGIGFSDDLDAMLSGALATDLPKNVCGGTLSGSSLITFSGGTLDPEEICTFSVQVAVPLGAAAGNYPNTTSSVSATVAGTPVTWDAASDLLHVSYAPLLTKNFTDDPAVAGATATLEFTITNPSTTDSMSAIAFTDVLTPPFGASVSLASSASPNPPCGVGSTLTLTGLDPKQLTFANGSLAPGASCTFSVGVNIPADMSSGTYLMSTGPISATLAGSSVVGKPASDTLSIVSAPRLLKSFAQSAVAGETVTLQFSLLHHENAPASATAISFSDNLESVLSGLVSISGTQTDICGSGSSLSGTSTLTFSGGTLAPGARCDFNVTLQIPSSAAAGSYANVINDLSANVGGTPLLGANASANLQIIGLKLTKSFLSDPAFAGGQVTLRFVLQNNSALDATAIGFTDVLTSALSGLTADGTVHNDICGSGSSLSGTTTLTFAGGSLLAGESCQFDVVLTIPASASVGEYINRTGNVTATIGGSGATIDPAAAQLRIAAPLQISKSFLQSVAMPGDSVTMRITLSNIDPSNPITAISLSDDLDAALTGLVAVGLPANDVCGAGSTLSGSGLLTLTGASLAADSNCSFDVTLNIPSSVAQGDTLTNTTSSVSATHLGNPISIGGASASLYINNLILTKTFTGIANPGGSVTLAFHIENIGATGQTLLAFTDDLSATLSGLSAIGLPASNVCGSGSTFSGTTFLTLSGGSLAAGASCDFNVTLQVPVSAIAGSYTNTTGALLSGGLTVAAPASATLQVAPAPGFSKSFAPSTILIGNTSTLTFNIDNSQSPFTAAALSFSDALPTGLSVATPANASTTCTGGTLVAVAGSGTLSYSGGSVAASSSCTVVVDVTSSTEGSYTNVSGALSSSLGTSTTASADLEVVRYREIDLRGNGISISSGDTTPQSADATDFGESDLAAGAIAHTFTIHNLGGDDLLLSGTPIVALSGDSGDFSVIQPLQTTVAPLGSTTFEVRFDPATIGLKSVTLSIANNDTNENPYTITLQGVGYGDNDGITEPSGTDGNFDGIEDRNQANVTTFTSGSTQLTLSSGSSQSFSGVSAPQTDPLTVTLNDGREVLLPYGTVSFTLTGLGSATEGTVTLHYPYDTSLTGYAKEVGGVWYDLNASIEHNTTGGYTALTFSITDGGMFDLDGAQNGEVQDPGGAYRAAAIPVPLFAPAGLLWLALLMGALGIRRLNRL